MCFFFKLNFVRHSSRIDECVPAAAAAARADDGDDDSTGLYIIPSLRFRAHMRLRIMCHVFTEQKAAIANSIFNYQKSEFFNFEIKKSRFIFSSHPIEIPEKKMAPRS